MSKNTIQAFQLLLIVIAFVAGGAWCVTAVPPAILWGLRLGTPVIGMIAGYCFYKLSRRPDTLPDLLRNAAGKYFEQDGFCFAPILDVIDGTCRLNIYFQNRFAGHASARVKMLPPLRTLGLGRHSLPTIAVAIECPGGAFGVLRMPFPILAKYQGKRMGFDVGADVKYPARRGKPLRFRSGRGVPSTSQTGRTGWGIIGVMRSAAQGNAKLHLPKNLRGESTPLLTQTEILWLPDQPTGGFPVLQAKSAA